MHPVEVKVLNHKEAEALQCYHLPVQRTTIRIGLLKPEHGAIAATYHDGNGRLIEKPKYCNNEWLIRIIGASMTKCRNINHRKHFQTMPLSLSFCTIQYKGHDT
jgi:hypothetical protein